MLLYFMGRKPMKAAATKKREDFLKVFEEAQAAKDAAEKRLAEVEERLSRLDSELADLLKKGEEDAQREAAKIVAQGEALASHLRKEATRLAEAETESARVKLHEDALVAVRDAVLEKTKSGFSPDVHERITRHSVSLIK